MFRRFISNIRWSSNLPNPYGSNPSRKAQIEELVVNHAKNKGVDARGAQTAVIVYDKSIVVAACISILPTTIYLGQPNMKGVPAGQLQIMSPLSSKMGRVHISPHSMLTFQNEGCHVFAIQVHPYLPASSSSTVMIFSTSDVRQYLSTVLAQLINFCNANCSGTSE